MVYLEAQSMGLPVIALNNMGVPLVVSHGKTGLLADSDKDLQNNLASLLSHPDLRSDLAKAAAHYVHNSHSLAAAADNLKSALEPLIQRS